MWHNDGFAEIVKAEAKPFVATSNAIDALLYIKDMHFVTFFGRKDEGHCISYAMSQGQQIQEAKFSGPIFTFTEDFEESSNND